MRISVLAGSKSGVDQAYSAAARKIGKATAEAGVLATCGGGRSGVMGSFVEAHAQAGGRVHAVSLKVPDYDEPLAEQVSSVSISRSLMERKAEILRGADVILALPGGVGVADELFHAYALARIGQITAPIIVINVSGFFDHLMEFLDHMSAQGFLSAKGYKPIVMSLESAIQLLIGINENRFLFNRGP